ncbi:MAG: hypothetical protein IJO13_07120 [Lachnospiraceae bacterium]|nr:hypothetical protein [Lachnospiraceae bacterium]
MAKGVILKTNEGIKLMGNIQCSNGGWFDAEGCYNYCNIDERDPNGNASDTHASHQAFKLSAAATTLAHNPKTEKDWYRNKENFVDIEIPYNCDQSFPNLLQEV